MLLLAKGPLHQYLFILKSARYPAAASAGSGRSAMLKSETAFLDGKLIPLLLPEFPKKSARETKHDKAITTKFKSV